MELKEGLWLCKYCEILYELTELEDGNFNAHCITSGNDHLIEKDKCRNFLNNHKLQ